MEKDYIEISKKTALKIHVERVKRKLTQQDMGEVIGLSRCTFGKIERGDIPVPKEAIEKIAQVLEIDVNDLLNISHVYI